MIENSVKKLSDNFIQSYQFLSKKNESYKLDYSFDSICVLDHVFDLIRYKSRLSESEYKLLLACSAYIAEAMFTIVKKNLVTVNTEVYKKIAGKEINIFFDLVDKQTDTVYLSTSITRAILEGLRTVARSPYTLNSKQKFLPKDNLFGQIVISIISGHYQGTVHNNDEKDKIEEVAIEMQWALAKSLSEELIYKHGPNLISFKPETFFPLTVQIDGIPSEDSYCVGLVENLYQLDAKESDMIKFGALSTRSNYDIICAGGTALLCAVDPKECETIIKQASFTISHKLHLVAKYAFYFKSYLEGNDQWKNWGDHKKDILPLEVQYIKQLQNSGILPVIILDNMDFDKSVQFMGSVFEGNIVNGFSVLQDTIDSVSETVQKDLYIQMGYLLLLSGQVDTAVEFIEIAKKLNNPELDLKLSAIDLCIDLLHRENTSSVSSFIENYTIGSLNYSAERFLMNCISLNMAKNYDPTDEEAKFHKFYVNEFLPQFPTSDPIRLFAARSSDYYGLDLSKSNIWESYSLVKGITTFARVCSESIL